MTLSRRDAAAAGGADEPPARVSAMNRRTTVLERAFELARSGRPRRTEEIVATLRREGFPTEQIEGPVLKRQLLNLMKAARAGSSDVDRAPRPQEEREV
jgi:hypothetical protein